MNDPYLEKIRDYVRQRSRLSFAGHKKAVLRQRLESRLAQLDLPDLTSYWDYLHATAGEERELFDLLTTNETFFFRNPEQFRHLREVVLPQLEQARGLDVVRSWGSMATGPSADIMKLRILSAGCSTGEEPYSIAMTVLEGLRYPRAWKIDIVAGDLSETCLETARKGYYETDRLKTVPFPYAAKYLEQSEHGATVCDEVKELVSFTSLNLNGVMSGEDLATPVGAGEFDIIFCRNVMIYFSPECQQLLVDSLYRLLAPGGYLYTGDAEPLHLFDHDFTAVQSAGCLVYQKRWENCHVQSRC